MFRLLTLAYAGILPFDYFCDVFMDNTSPVIRLFFAKMKNSYLELSDKEKKAFMAKDRNNLDELGMTAITMIDCTGFNDEWDYIGVEQWPSLEAIVTREKFENDDLQLARYVNYKTVTGKELSYVNYGR